MNADQPTPPRNDERRRHTDRRPAVRFIGLGVSMFWTVAIITIVAIAVILYFALR